MLAFIFTICMHKIISILHLHQCYLITVKSGQDSACSHALQLCNSDHTENCYEAVFKTTQHVIDMKEVGHCSMPPYI